MATYQDLGYLEGNRLTVLSPVRKIRQYTVRPLQDGTCDELPVRQTDQSLVRQATGILPIYEPVCESEVD